MQEISEKYDKYTSHFYFYKDSSKNFFTWMYERNIEYEFNKNVHDGIGTTH